MAGLVKLHCGNWVRDEWLVWAVLDFGCMLRARNTTISNAAC